MSRRDAAQLLALLASFVVAGYAGVRLLAGNPSGVGAWFVGSAVAHDLVLFPLYGALDAALVTLLRRRPALATISDVPWLNHLRIPTVISGILLLVWSPLILQLTTDYSPAYPAASGLSAQPYLPRWLSVSAVLFTVSAILLAGRVVRATRSADAGHGPPVVQDGK